jgi:multimeric flavodoxin WrbA
MVGSFKKAIRSHPSAIKHFPGPDLDSQLNADRRKLKAGFLMIRILGISGSPVKDGNTEALLREALRASASNPEVETETIHLSTLEIAGCRHCNWCIKHQTAEKYCVVSDAMDGVYPELLKADVLLLATPVHIGRMSGLMSNMIDRLRVFVYGNFHSGKLKDKIGASLVVAFLRHGGLEMTLWNLNSTFALFQMIAVGQGGLVLTSVDGKGKITRGVRHMALEDSFGLLSAKAVVMRALELARIVQAGKKALGREP